MKKQKEEKGLSRFITISGEKKGRMALSVLLATLSAVLQMVPLWSIYSVMKELLINASTENYDIAVMTRAAIIGLIALLVGYLCEYLSGVIAHIFTYRVICGVRLKVSEHIGKLPLGYVTNNSVGKIKQILETDIDNVEVFLAHQFPDMVATLVMLLCMFIVMFTINVPLAFMTLAAITIGFGAQVVVVIRLLKSGAIKANFDALEKISASSLEYVKGMPSIKIFGQTIRSFHKFYDDIMSYKKFTTEMTEKIRPGFVTFRVFVLSVATFIVPVGLLLFFKNPSDVAFAVSYIFFLVLGPGVSSPVLKLRNFSENMNVITESTNRVDEVLAIEPISRDCDAKIINSYDICFKNVGFSYDQSDEGKTILKNINMTAKQGEITALVGPSGAGKSTIAELIPRFWDVTEGAITIGGEDIRELSDEQLMSTMSFVFQDSFLFSDTIFKNIAIGRENATKEEVIKAAKAAQCHEFIMSLPNGYETVIGEGGVYLSGGEQQRVSIARAILKNAPILILDEATAYADAESEHEVQLALAELIKNKTVIMIAHRLTTITEANQINVVDNGSIVESGTHKELFDKNGLYASMWNAALETAGWQIALKEGM